MVEAVSCCPSVAVPVIAGAPVGAVFVGVLNNRYPIEAHGLAPIALVTWTCTSYRVFG